MNDTKVIILAAGKGTRINDENHPMPKVLREAHGRPLISYVIDSTSLLGIKPEDITIVVGYMKEMVVERFKDCGYKFAVQDDGGYGTGYAVKCAMEQSGLNDFGGTIVILSGDVPLVKKETVFRLADENLKNGNSCTLLSCISKRELPFGRIIRDENGRFTGIVEDKNCSPEQKKIRELNVATYAFDAKKLAEALKEITFNSLTGEMYLTDVPAVMLAKKEKIDAVPTDDETEMLGVNTFADLKIIEDVLDSRA